MPKQRYSSPCMKQCGVATGSAYVDVEGQLGWHFDYSEQPSFARPSAPDEMLLL